MITITGVDGRARLEPDNYILQDGETMRVPLMFTDEDSGGDNRNDAAERKRDEAYREYADTIRNRWRGPDTPQPPQQASFTDAAAARAAAYQQYERDIKNRWRSK
jgi:hypothetical protein